MDDRTGHHHNGDHRAYQELLGAYALGAVSQDEGRALAAHVASCPSCRAELARLRAAVTALPLTIEEREPPPISRYRLEARVLHDLAHPTQPLQPDAPVSPMSPVQLDAPVWPASPAAPVSPLQPRTPGWPVQPDATDQPDAPAWPGRAFQMPEPVTWKPQISPTPSGQAFPASPAAAAPAGPIPATGRPAAAPPPAASPVPIGTRMRRLPLVWLGVAAVLAVFAAGLLVWNLDLRQDLDEREPPAAVALLPEQATDGASATMTYLEDAGVMVIALHGAPPPAANEVYQLWLVHDTVVVPFGVFDKETAECAVVVDPALYQQLVITREPGPFGSPSAVGPTILAAPIDAA